MSNSKKESEYLEIFLSEAIENSAELNRLLIVLEKNINDKRAIQSLFRITHTLKGNASGMGYEEIAAMAHILEDFFGEVREGRIVLEGDLFASIFRASDVLTELINAIKEPKEVKYKGIKAKIEVLIRNARKEGERAQPGQNVSTGEESSGDINEAEDDFESDSTNITISDLVQVPVKKLDNLLNLVGELIIERDRLLAGRSDSSPATDYARLSRISSDLQYSVMDVRLVQVGFLLNKFHRIVRDVSAKEGKLVNLKLEGTETEIDRSILHVISDSLIHLIRNSVGHGVELPDKRTKAGKIEAGTVTIAATSESDTVFIRVKDDGAGIDPQKIKEKAILKGLVTRPEADQMTNGDLIMLIFEPGFSTMDEVTSVSGRGVGMDVVKKAIDSVGGTVQVDSIMGEGTIFTLSLPASMAVKATLLCNVSDQTYAIPLAYTESVISIYRSEVHKTGQGLVVVHQEKAINLIFLEEVFDRAISSGDKKIGRFDSLHPEQKLDVVLISFNGKKIGLIVNKLLQQKEIVEKPLSKPYEFHPFFSGVTILGSGSVCLVLNIPGLITFLTTSQQKRYVKNN